MQPETRPDRRPKPRETSVRSIRLPDGGRVAVRIHRLDAETRELLHEMGAGDA